MNLTYLMNTKISLKGIKFNIHLGKVYQTIEIFIFVD
jgi:hypothetical protein